MTSDTAQRESSTTGSEDRSVPAIKAVGDELGNLGRRAAAAQKHKRAVLYFESALTAHRGIGDAGGVLLDLQSQGEALLSLQGELGAGVAGLKLAAELGARIEVPEAEQLEARYLIILRQLEGRFPDKAAQLRQALAVDAEAVRVDGVHAAMVDPGLSLAFFEDQLGVARLLEDQGGVFACLGSQAQILADIGEVGAACAAFVMAREVAEEVGPESETLLAEWRSGLVDAAGGEAAFLSALDKAVVDSEASRSAAVARILQNLS